MRRVGLLLVICCLCGVLPAIAQNPPPVLSLESDSTNLQTGQAYTITLYLERATNVWLLDTVIEYDPTLIYVIGTKSGSPMLPGTLFAPDSVVLFNSVRSLGSLHYLVSQLAPAEPITGGGVVATFQIYPLSAGTTSLTFSAGEINTVTFTTDSNGQRAPSEPVKSAPAVTVLDLTITGDTVEAPSEATATPAPTETAILPQLENTQVPTATLLVVTAESHTPIVTSTPETLVGGTPEEKDDNTDPLRVVLAGAIAALVGFILLAGVVYIRSRRH